MVILKAKFSSILEILKRVNEKECTNCKIDEVTPDINIPIIDERKTLIFRSLHLY